MLRRFNIKTASVFCLILLAASCATPSYLVRQPSEAAIANASEEISSTNRRPRRNVSMLDARGRVGMVYSRLMPSAQQLCRYLSERSAASCSNWQVAVDDSLEFFAYATGSNEIVLSKGVIEQSRYDDEVAFVLAHELSHHMLDHIREDQTNALVGSFLGALLSAAVASVALEAIDCNPYYENCDYAYDLAGGIIDTGVNAGSYITSQQYSVRQESEADLVAAYILSHSSFNLIRAREALLNTARMSGSTNNRSSFLDSHPAGPERLAQFDGVIQEVFSNRSRVP